MDFENLFWGAIGFLFCAIGIILMIAGGVFQEKIRAFWRKGLKKSEIEEQKKPDSAEPLQDKRDE